MPDLAQSQQDHGAWEYDPASRRTRWSHALYAIHGVDPASCELTEGVLRSFIHPDDLATYEAIVRDAIETRTPFACQHRIARPDGELRVLIVRGSFVEGGGGVPDRLIGTTQDVTGHDTVPRANDRARSAEEPTVEVATEDELRGAIGGQELVVQFQPIVSLEDGGTQGCEALVRWEHPIKGLMGPGGFVSMAEESGLISKIGRVVLESACRQAAEWKRQGRSLFVSVNISPRQLTRSDLASDVSHALAASDLPAELLCLEVTETALLRDSGPSVESLRRLKSLGVRLAIDDFGAGASSFGILHILPIDQIKIDHSFIHGLGNTTSDRAVVAAVVSLAKELGLTVIAEGVETERQQAELRELGAELAQGFLYSPARNAEELQLDAFGATVTRGAA